MACNICCDTYNVSSRAKVNCSYCDFDACRQCCETYILSESLPKCLNIKCNKEWTRKFIREKFTNTFVNNKFKKHLEDVLFEQEKALMPATQPIIEEMNRKKHIRREIKRLDELIENLNHERRVLERSIDNPDLDKSKEKNKSSGFMRSCAAEGCRGFLSSQWKCGICELWTCPDCHELKGDKRDDPDHKCDPNNVETAKLLNKDTKPCPKCQTKIFKIDGCDQMWCTQCHTAFSWKTGALSTSIHNPHYFEWLRKNGGAPRAAGDIICGQELNHHTPNQITDIIYRKKHNNLIRSIEHNQYYRNGVYVKYTENVIKLQELIRQVIHIRHAEAPRYRVDHFEKNQELRVKYLCNEIDEEELKIQVQRNDKKHRKLTDILNVFTLVDTTMTDLVYRIIDSLEKSKPDEHSLDIILKEVDELVEYSNILFKDIAFTYNCICHCLDQNLRLRTFRLEKPNKKPRKAKASAASSAANSDNEDEDENEENQILSIQTFKK
jgi:hypothetical protein